MHKGKKCKKGRIKNENNNDEEGKRRGQNL